MNQPAACQRPATITNREAEKRLCPLLSTVDDDSRLVRFNCVHEQCVYWDMILPDGSDKQGNGVGRCPVFFNNRA